MKKTIQEAFKTSIPVMLGYIFVGCAFGLLFEKNGYSIWVALALSLFVYSGSLQFIALTFFTPVISFVQVALMTLFVNARHLFYGLSFIDVFKRLGNKKYYAIHALTDESYSLLVSVDAKREDYLSYILWIELFNHCYWISGTLLGFLLANVITFDTTGLDFAMNALFIVIFTEQWLSTKQHFPAILGVVCTTCSLLLFGADVMILPAMALILLVLLLARKHLEKDYVK